MTQVRKFVRYEIATGRIIQSGTDCAPELLLQDGEALILDAEALVGMEFVKLGCIMAMPQRPSPSHAFDYASEAWVLSPDAAWSAVKQQRNTLLQQCDWASLPDVPMSGAKRVEWAAYRQALRDITNQPDPLNISWPSTPA